MKNPEGRSGMDRVVETLERVGELVKGEDAITVWRKAKEEGCWYFVVEEGCLWFYPLPFPLEEWIEGKLREGYNLELEVEKLHYTDLTAKLAGKELRQWYEKLLSYYDPEEGLEIPRQDWEEYWLLLKWEREILQKFFGRVLSEIHAYSLEVSRKVAEEFEKYDEEEREDVVIFTGADEVQQMLADKLEGKTEEWKKWVSDKVLLNLMGLL
jgi:hypothetical protein